MGMQEPSVNGHGAWVTLCTHPTYIHSFIMSPPHTIIWSWSCPLPISSFALYHLPDHIISPSPHLSPHTVRPNMSLPTDIFITFWLDRDHGRGGLWENRKCQWFLGCTNSIHSNIQVTTECKNDLDIWFNLSWLCIRAYASSSWLCVAYS